MTDTPDNATPSGGKGAPKALPLRRIAREWALQYLYQLDISAEEYSETSFAWFWRQLDKDEFELTDKVAEKCRMQALGLIHGVLENRQDIDITIDREAKNWDVDRMATVDRNIIRLATHEILNVDDVPAAVSIDEALEICKKFGGGEDSKGFINGILDKIYHNSK